MAYPIASNVQNQLKTRIYESCSSSTLTLGLNNTIAFRCKYLSTLMSLTGGTTAGGTSQIDIGVWQGALQSTAGTAATSAPNFTTVTSGLTITTSTGNQTFLYTAGSSGGPVIYLNQGDIISVYPSTGASSLSVTHVVQEF